MTIENTPGAELAAQRPADVVVNPGTGSYVGLDAPAPELVRFMHEAKALAADVTNAAKEAERELIRRLDARQARTAELDGAKLETNKPVDDVYDAVALRQELEELVAAGTIARELVDELVVEPAPAPPAPRVDKRVANRIMAGDNRELMAVVARHRQRLPQSRKLTVKSMPVEGTAEEV